jgi:sporulation protein YlmC with PRC-barrel domain
MKDHEFDIGYWLLDDQLLDSEGRRCGRVDDVRLEGSPGHPAKIAAILSGPGAFRRRLPGRLRKIADRMISDREVEVPWSAVKDIEVTVKLKKPAAELGLARGDERAAKTVEKLPDTG